MISKIFALIKKHQETLAYLFFGSLTVLFNTVVFLIFDLWLDEILANTLAFLLSVQFAYMTNTWFVFKMPFTKANFLKFWGMRIGTILIDNAGLWVLLALECNKLIAKCVINIIIIILNYIFSKFFIYKRKEGEK